MGAVAKELIAPIAGLTQFLPEQGVPPGWELSQTDL
jgi:hypothetical protein